MVRCILRGLGCRGASGCPHQPHCLALPLQGKVSSVLPSVCGLLFVFFHKERHFRCLFFFTVVYPIYALKWNGFGVILRPISCPGLGRGDLWLRTILAVVVWCHLLATLPIMSSYSCSAIANSSSKKRKELEKDTVF